MENPHTELNSLRMIVAIDSAMLLSVLRRMHPDELARVSTDFLQACEGLNIKTLYSEMDDEAIAAAQTRRNWWIGLVAELVSEDAKTQAKPN